MSRSATRSGEFIARGHLKLDHAEFTARAGCTQDPEGHRVSGSAYDERRETRTAATHFIVIARYISYSQHDRSRYESSACASRLAARQFLKNPREQHRM